MIVLLDHFSLVHNSAVGYADRCASVVDCSNHWWEGIVCYLLGLILELKMFAASLKLKTEEKSQNPLLEF